MFLEKTIRVGALIFMGFNNFLLIRVFVEKEH